MGHRLLREVSPTGVEHSIEIDNDGNGFTAFEFTPTHVEKEILDGCARMRSLHQNSQSNFRLAARVPINTHTAWRREWMEKYRDTWTWQTFLAMKLNNRDNSYLRTGFKRGGSMKL